MAPKRAAVNNEVVIVPRPRRGAYAALWYDPTWLPMETAFRWEIDLRRRQWRRLGQVGMFHGGGVKRNVELIRRLWRRIQRLGLDEVYACVAPADVGFWKRLCFQDTCWPSRHWDFANAPVVAVVLDVRTVRERASDAVRRRFLVDDAP